MSVVDGYLQGVKSPEKEELEKVRQLILSIVPEAKEVITYGMPGFKYKGKYLISFAAFKDHLSIFPGAEAVETYQDQLKDYTTSKGTIQFTLDHPLPDVLLRQIINSGMQRIDSK